MCSSGVIGVLVLYALLFRLPGLRRYVRRDHQDLTIWDLKHLSWIVREMVVRVI
jgi:hypothetical protein